MKRLVLVLLGAVAAFRVPAETNSIPSTALIVSSTNVVTTVTREPRTLVVNFSRETGEPSAEVTYETVTRVGSQVVAYDLFRVSTLTWSDITNKVPSSPATFAEFRAASLAAMTNSP